MPKYIKKTIDLYGDCASLQLIEIMDKYKCIQYLIQKPNSFHNTRRNMKLQVKVTTINLRKLQITLGLTKAHFITYLIVNNK